MLWWIVLFAMYFGWALGAGKIVGQMPPKPRLSGISWQFSSTFQTSSQTFSWIRSWIRSGGGEHQQIAEWNNEFFVCDLRRDCKTGSPWLVNQSVHVDLFLFLISFIAPFLVDAFCDLKVMIASNCPYVFKAYALFIVCAFSRCLGLSWN